MAQDLTFEDVNLVQNPDNALRVQATLTTSEPAHVYVQYAYTQNGEMYTETSTVSALQKEHDINLLALRDSTFYQFRIFAFNKKNKIQSQLYELITPKLPLEVQNFESSKVSRLENRQTYTITNTMRGSQSYYFICDAEGRLVWYADYPVLHNVCNGWRWSKDNTILQGDCKTIREMDLLGNLITEIDIDEPEWNLHHDLMKMRDGNIIAIYTKPEMADLTNTTGNPESIVAVDGYIVVNPEGETIENWSTSDHFDIQTAERKGAYWNFIYGSGTVDWCHFNAIEEDIDGSILISVSHWSTILKIDRASGEVKWQLGERGTLRVPPGFTFRQQHAITVLAPNRYLIFDNLGLQESSRAMEFAVETIDNRAFQFWEYIPQPNIVSLTRGNAERLSNGNTLIFFPTNRGIIQEINEEGELLWEVETQRSGYRAYRIPYINKPHPKVRFTELPQSVCSNAEPFEIMTEPTEAYLMGEAIEDGKFNPQKANLGLNKIFAAYGTTLQEINIEVWAAPEADIQITDNELLEITDAFETYQWYLNDTLIEGANNHQYQPAASGLYYAEISNQNNCIAYSDTLNYVYANIAEHLNDALQFMQLGNFLIIEHPGTPSFSIEIFNLQGQKIFAQHGQSNYQINTAQFPSIYLVRISFGKHFWVEKLLQVDNY